jgi:prophage regulatory protein
MNQSRQAMLPSDADATSTDIVRLPTVLKMTGLGRSTIYRLIADHRFPSQVLLADRAVGWRRSDVAHWSQSRQSVQQPSA